MKWLLRNTALYAFALYILPSLISGVTITGGYTTYVIGGIALTIMLLIIKPIISVISLPLNIITLGLFSSLTNVIILYLLTVLVPNIVIKPFVFQGLTYTGFTIPKFELNSFFAYVLAAIVISAIIACINWLTK